MNVDRYEFTLLDLKNICIHCRVIRCSFNYVLVIHLFYITFRFEVVVSIVMSQF